MGQLQIEIEPEEVGLDPRRLQRIDRHFERYVADGKLPGWLVLVTRAGKVAHLSTHGLRDVEAQLPVETDTLFRVYSMTKPVTSLAAMMLYEEGAFELSDPVSDFIPSFADMRVYVSGPPQAPQTRPATEPVRLWHLLTHTSGLTYGFHGIHPMDAVHRARGFDLPGPDHLDLAACCDAWADIPLLFDPGQGWNYSVSTDVLGRVVEIVSGQRLDAFFRERIFDPLDMRDTSFTVDASDHSRLAALYGPGNGGGLVRNDKAGAVVLREQLAHSGGGGLVSSARDYHRFTQMLLGGGRLDDIRLLGRRTLDYMTRNHLPGGVDLAAFAVDSFSEATNAGKGFGLGFAVVQDPVAGKVLCSPGEFSWGGMASTAFWVDPHEDITVLFLTQLMPSSTYPIRSQLHQLVYQALVD